jgi:VIT1/CCC1 family predicted Fe2+/Mn2+ transporter
MSSEDPVPDEWDPTDRAHWRMLRVHGNDGLIAAAGIAQGLSSAGATGLEALVAAIATTVVGGLVVFGAEYGEAAGDRDSQLAIIAAERRRLEASPEQEFAELVDLYRAKGLSAELAVRVATELSEKDALAAQLDAEYGISAIGDLIRPGRVARWYAGAFVVGSLVPVPFLAIIPVLLREMVLALVVILALSASAILGARADYTDATRALTRTLAIGVGSMAISLIAGSLLSF